MTQDPNEPGQVEDKELGIPGPEEPMPENDAEQDEPTMVHEDEHDDEEPEDDDVEYGEPEDEN